MPKINSSFTSKVRNPGRSTLLDYLALRFTYHSREAWAALLEEGRLELDGRRAGPVDALREGQMLRFAVVDYEEPEVPVDFSVLGGEGDLRFLHKPAGMPVHRTGKIFFQTLANLARERFGDDAWAPLNRLDRDTSGIVAFARGSGALSTLGPAVPGVEWFKLYAAVVWSGPSPGEPAASQGGRLEAFPSLAAAGRIDIPLGPLPDSRIRVQMHPRIAGPGALSGPPDPAVKNALTLFHTLAHRDGKSLVVLSPITGRRHQLRAHLAALGCPVVGDKIYSGGGAAYIKQLDGDLQDADYAALGARRHLLHAFHLRIDAAGRAQDAWDWDAGGEFAGAFDISLAREWAAGPGFAAMAEAAAEARRILKVTGA